MGRALLLVWLCASGRMEVSDYLNLTMHTTGARRQLSLNSSTTLPGSVRRSLMVANCFEYAPRPVVCMDRSKAIGV